MVDNESNFMNTYLLMGRPPLVSRAEVLAAARAAFAERGYDGTTLAAIATRLSLSPAALRRHAPNKAALFQAALAPAEPSEPLPMHFLASLDGNEDPRLVLRRLAEAFVPFAEAKIGESIARWQHTAAAGDPGIGLTLTSQQADAPRRGLSLVETYLRRAQRAGRVAVADPRAAALAFMASLQSYVFLHQVMRVLEPPLPLDRYLDCLLDIWTRGALRPAASTAPSNKPRNRRKRPA